MALLQKSLCGMSTLAADWVQALNTAITQQGAGFLDAPVVGSRPQAEARKLSMWVGGPVDYLEPVRSLFHDLGATAIHHMGKIGQGTAMKLAVNALFGIQVAALAELVGLLSKHGVSPSQAMDCLAALPVLSLAAKGAGNLMIEQNHAPLFPIELVEKDFCYVMQTAQSLQSSLPTAAVVLEIYQMAIAHGHGNKNITGIGQRFLG